MIVLENWIAYHPHSMQLGKLIIIFQNFSLTTRLMMKLLIF